MTKALLVIALAAVAAFGCGGGAGGGGAAGCQAGWSNYCNKLFTCDPAIAEQFRAVYQNEAACSQSLGAACAGIQAVSGTCAASYNACTSSLQSLTCANLTGGGGFEQPDSCTNLDGC